MLAESKKKAKRLNSIRGTQRFTRPSQANGTANIPIKIEEAIPKLKNLAQKYIGITNPHGFLTDLRNALGIPDKQGASKYGVVAIPKSDGSVLQASLRVTNHNSNAETYITHNANYEYNLSIMVRKNFNKNTFKPHDDVRLDEYVYFGKRMEQVENPLTQIINSIIGFLKEGEYKDTTGIAMKHISPQQANNKENSQEIKENRNMNKKLIKLTEQDIHRIVKESVNSVLNKDKSDFKLIMTKTLLNSMVDALETNNIEKLAKCNIQLQVWINRICGNQQQSQQSQQPMQPQGQQPTQQAQGMPSWMSQYAPKQQLQQLQQMSQQPQSMQQQQPTQQQNAIDQRVQDQMSKNLRLQQQMADKISNKTLNRIG